MKLTAQTCLLIAVAAVVGAVGNALSPAGISWNEADGGPALGRVGFDQARRIVEQQAAIVLDARQTETFVRGHIPGARSVPWSAAATHLAEMRPPLKAEQKILVYCSSEQCGAALVVGRLLRRRGFKDVAIFVGWFDVWQRSGGRIERD